MIEVITNRTSRVRQGDIIRDVEFVEYVSERDGIVEISKIVFPLAIVLTQDCDLEQDHKFRADNAKSHDKRLMSVLVAPLYNIEHVYQGQHLSELNLTMEPISKGRSPGTYLRNNDRPRYHYLDFTASIPIVPSVVDFKHYFSVNVLYLDRLREENFVCSLVGLFRQDVSARFAAFLARVALPELADIRTPPESGAPSPVVPPETAARI